MEFEEWWESYLKQDGNEVLSDYEKEVARAAWEASEADAVIGPFDNADDLIKALKPSAGDNSA